MFGQENKIFAIVFCGFIQSKQQFCRKPALCYSKSLSIRIQFKFCNQIQSFWNIKNHSFRHLICSLPLTHFYDMCNLFSRSYLLHHLLLLTVKQWVMEFQIRLEENCYPATVDFENEAFVMSKLNCSFFCIKSSFTFIRNIKELQF